MKRFMPDQALWIEKMTSLCLTANFWPRPDEPAWNTSGRPCGEGSTDGVA